MNMKKHERALTTLMGQYGYTLKRQTKHMVWTNATGHTVTTSKTPSDTNALRQVERGLKRAAAAA